MAELNPTTDERRETGRCNLMVPLRVFDRSTGEMIGHAVNVSLRGMLVVGESELDGPQTIQIDLEIPGDGGQWERTPIVARRVRNFVDPDDKTLFNTGFQFEEISPQALFNVQRLIDDVTSFS